MKKILVAVLMLCCFYRVQAQNVEGQIIAAQYGEFKVPGEKTGTFQFPAAVCQVSGGGKNFDAFSTGVAVKIVDSNPALTEVATPSSVFINQCSMNMATTYTHVPPYYLTSGTGGLQEAITANQTNNGINSIILNWEWYAEIQPRNAATVIGSVTGITSLGLVDITTTPYTYYRWNGSQYVAIPTNGSVASVGLTAPGSVFGVTGSPVTVSGNLGLTLNNQSANTSLRGPASGSAAAPTFRTDTSADVLQAGTLYNALTSGDVNGMMYPAQCGGANPPSWCAGSTPDAWIRAACTQLPSSGGTINFLGLTGTIAATVPCSSPTKQVIFLQDDPSALTITESDGGIVFPLDNGSMFLGPGAGQCNFPNGGIHLGSSANVTAIVGPAHTDGTQENFTADGLCLFGANGATVTRGLIYAKAVFTNTDTSNNNAGICNTACEWIENVGGLMNVTNNWYNATDGVFGITGSPLVIASTGSAGCENQSINVFGGTYEHANGGASFPEISIIGNGSGALGCSISVKNIYTEKNVSGTPSTIGIKVQDCFNCTFADIESGGGSGTTGDMLNLSQSATGRVQNVTFSSINNSFASWANTINDSTPGGSVIPFSAYQFVTFYPSNPGYIQPAVLPGTAIQSVSGDVMSGAGNFSTGSGTIGTNFGVTGCNVNVACTLTRDNSTAPPGNTYSQKIQITANTDPSGGFNGVQYTPTVSFTAGTPYEVSFWGKGDGSFTGFPTFLLWNSSTPVFYCNNSTITAFSTTWTLYSSTCTPSVSGSAFIAVTARTPTLATGTFWLGGFTFSPVVPLTPASLLTSVGPYSIGPATNAQQTITLGTTALLLGQTVGTVASLALTTSSINGVTPTTGGSASAYLNGAGNYTTAFLSGTTGTITGTALSATCDSGTATVTGAVVGHPVAVSSTTGVDVGGAFYLRGSVTSTNTVTVYVCGTGTPSSLAYNVAVF